MKKEERNRNGGLLYGGHQNVPNRYPISTELNIGQELLNENLQTTEMVILFRENEYVLRDTDGLRETTLLCDGLITAVGCMDVGKRQVQQDSFSIQEMKIFEKPECMAILADGLGENGKKGSLATVSFASTDFEALRNSGMDMPHALYQTMINMHAMVLDLEASTTATAVVISGNECYIANTGDSRTYLLRAGEIIRLTNDQSIVWDAVEKGFIREKDIYTDPRNSFLRDCLGRGNKKKPAIDIYPLTLRTEDRLILCSDGVWKEIGDNSDLGFCANAETVELSAIDLIRYAKQKDGDDNKSVIVLEVNPKGYQSNEAYWFTEFTDDITINSLESLRKKVNQYTLGLSKVDIQSRIDDVLDETESIEEIFEDDSLDKIETIKRIPEDGGLREKLQDIVTNLSSFYQGRKVLTPQRSANAPFSYGEVLYIYDKDVIKVKFGNNQTETYPLDVLDSLNTLKIKDIDATYPYADVLLSQTLRRRGGIVMNGSYYTGEEAVAFVEFLLEDRLIALREWSKTEDEVLNELLVLTYLIQTFPQKYVWADKKEYILELPEVLEEKIIQVAAEIFIRER